MTAIRAQRTRSTMLALAAAVVALVALGVLGVVGVRTLADSEAGRLAEGRKVVSPIQHLPHSATALIGIADEDGHLTSVVVAVLEPDYVGGTMIGLAATADASSGNNTVLVPLAAQLEVSGPTAFREAAERLTGLSFDVVEVIDQRRFVQLVTPLGDLPAVLPIPLLDSSTGEQWPSGEIVLSSASAARALTAQDEAIADWYFEPGRSAVWKAVADRVGAGIGTVSSISPDQDRPWITTLDQFLERLFAGPVVFRDLSFVVIDEQRVTEQLVGELADAFGPLAIDSVVAHSRAEMAMTFGAVAPGRLGAPADAPTFRVVSGYGEADLAGLGKNRSDLLQAVIDSLLFAGANIVAVADLPGSGAPELTQIRVADPSLVDDVGEVYGPLFGPVEVTAAEVVIDGVEIEVELGLSLIDELRAESTDALASSEDDASEDDDSDGGGDSDGAGDEGAGGG